MPRELGIGILLADGQRVNGRHRRAKRGYFGSVFCTSPSAFCISTESIQRLNLKWMAGTVRDFLEGGGAMASIEGLTRFIHAMARAKQLDVEATQRLMKAAVSFGPSAKGYQYGMGIARFPTSNSVHEISRVESGIVACRTACAFVKSRIGHCPEPEMSRIVIRGQLIREFL